MNKYTKNLIIIFIMISSLLFFGGFGFARAENRSENVKNTVSATANSGGNTISGSGTIRTGDVSATVEAKNYVNGGENIENKAEAKAEVQGSGGTASVSVNGEEKSCTASGEEGCRVELDSSFATVGENVVEPERIVEEEEKNILDKITGVLANLTEDTMNKIRSWFS